jgi:hypothetical protein
MRGRCRPLDADTSPVAAYLDADGARPWTRRQGHGHEPVRSGHHIARFGGSYSNRPAAAFRLPYPIAQHVRIQPARQGDRRDRYTGLLARPNGFCLEQSAVAPTTPSTRLYDRSFRSGHVYT